MLEYWRYLVISVAAASVRKWTNLCDISAATPRHNANIMLSDGFLCLLCLDHASFQALCLTQSTLIVNWVLRMSLNEFMEVFSSKHFNDGGFEASQLLTTPNYALVKCQFFTKYTNFTGEKKVVFLPLVSRWNINILKVYCY